MSVFPDKTGLRFGGLIVIRLNHLKSNRSWWLCKCDCGNEGVFRSDGLTGGDNVSCGCKKIDVLNVWDAAGSALAMRLRGEGKSYAEIAHSLGRSAVAVKAQILKLKRTPQQREAHRMTERLRYSAKTPQCRAEARIELSRPPAAGVDDRAKRINAPYRDLTAFLMGDPPKGYSALERRA